MEINHEKITKEFADNKTLIFFPGNKNEAIEIQRALFKMGYQWSGRGPWEIHDPEQMMYAKILLQHGKIYFGPNLDSFVNGLYCTAEQLRADYAGVPKIKFGFQPPEADLKTEFGVQTKSGRMQKQAPAKPVTRTIRSLN